MIFVAFPQEAATTPADVKLLYQKLDDLIQKHVATVTAPQTSSDDNNATSISFLLLVIKTLTEVQRNFIDPLILVRILQRLQRDMGSSASSHLRQVRWFYHLLCYDILIHCFKIKFYGVFCNTSPAVPPFFLRVWSLERKAREEKVFILNKYFPYLRIF